MKTTHLSPAEFVDLTEETLAPDRAAHVESCAACREQAGTLRGILRETLPADVPEPSPLFWEHMAARVRREVAAEGVAGRGGWMGSGSRRLVPLAAAAAVVIAACSGALLMRAVQTRDVPRVVAAGAPLVPPAGPARDGRPETTPDPENAEVWAVLTAAASTVAFDEAHDAGMHVHPGTIDHAVQDQSSAELTELGRLLQDELKRVSN
jgi:hypothetical protein